MMCMSSVNDLNVRFLNINRIVLKNMQIKIMINGDSSSFVFIRMSKNANFKEITKYIEEKLDWRAKTIRLFSPQGVEIFQDDLDFLKNGATLYVSKGIFIIFILKILIFVFLIYFYNNCFLVFQRIFVLR